MARRVLVLLIPALLGARPAASQWSGDPASNTPVCVTPGNESTPVIASDARGGSIMAWLDYRNGNSDIYAQRMRSTGHPAWTSNGIPICTLSHIQNSPAIVPDGHGGAIIVWVDYRTNDVADIYAQRVDSSGNALWTANGVPVCTAQNEQTEPVIVADGVGGVIAAWIDKRNSSPETDIYAQRISEAGAMMWAANGVAVCTATDYQLSPTVASDGNGSAIIAWEDWRSGMADLYAQRVTPGGTVGWASGGVALCTAAASQILPVAVADNSGGAIVTWVDRRGGSFADIYAQRIDSTGSLVWDPAGVTVSAGYNDQVYPSACTDGAGGAIVAWQDYRNSAAADIYAQRISPSGSQMWATDGVSVCTAVGLQESVMIRDDGQGGGVMAWDDDRSLVGFDIYAQRINPAGTVLWAADGVPACIASGDQTMPCIQSDGSGAAIVAWFDLRGADGDIYAQMEAADGALPIRLQSFGAAGLSDGGVRIGWTTASETGTYGFNVQRRLGGDGLWSTLAGSFRPGAGTSAEPRSYEFLDGAPPSGTLWYRLEEIDLDGTRTYTDPVRVFSVTAIEAGQAAAGISLQVFPNPCNPGTVVTFGVASPGNVTVALYDLLGREVSVLFAGPIEQGVHDIALGARNLSSGTYLCRLTTGAGSVTQRILILR
jgi:hypothetical protein